MPAYKKNFLTTVLYKLDFNEIEDLNNEDTLKKIFEKMKSTFSVQNIVQLTENAITFNALANTQTLSQKKTFRLECSSSDIKRFILDKNMLLIDLSDKYIDLDDFLKKINMANSVIFDVENDIKINRMGVRYVNQISLPDGDPFENGTYINQDLTRKEISFFTSEEKGKMNRSLSQTFLHFDEYDISFVTGYANSQFPARILKNEYVVDIECFTNTCEFDNIERLIRKMNTETITPLFERSITENLKGMMNQ